jgi:enterobactin synthetase component D
MRSTIGPEPGGIAAGPADPHQHILRVEWLPVAGPDAPVQACLLAGDPSAFDPRAFAQAGIECPERVARSVRKRQADFYFGRVAARLALTRLDGHAPDVPIGTSGEPQWPATRVGSITHSRDLAAAAVAPRAQVGALGIDIEHVVDPPALDALWTLALDQRERLMLERVSAHLTIEALATIVFSGKDLPAGAQTAGLRRRETDCVGPKRPHLDLRTVGRAGFGYPCRHRLHGAIPDDCARGSLHELRGLIGPAGEPEEGPRAATAHPLRTALRQPPAGGAALVVPARAAEELSAGGISPPVRKA